MKLSFIIPAYNEEGIIAACINSIIPQLNKDDEVIVVDNNCTDNTALVAKKCGARVVKERKKGISHARNKGASVAGGDVLCFVDADGELKDAWAKHARQGLKDKKVQAAIGINIFTHEKPSKYLLYNSYTVVGYSGLLLYKMVSGKTFLSGNNFAIRKDTFDKLGGFDPVVAEDYWLSKKFWKLKHKKAVFNPKMIIRYSSRGFDTAGYYKTINLWIKSALKPVSQENYSFENKDL